MSRQNPNKQFICKKNIYYFTHSDNKKEGERKKLLLMLLVFSFPVLIFSKKGVDFMKLNIMSRILKKLCSTTGGSTKHIRLQLVMMRLSLAQRTHQLPFSLLSIMHTFSIAKMYKEKGKKNGNREKRSFLPNLFVFLFEVKRNEVSCCVKVIKKRARAYVMVVQIFT